MDEFTIDDIVLRGMINLAKSDYKEILSNLENHIYGKNSDRDFMNTAKYCSNSVLFFIGAYNASLRLVDQLNIEAGKLKDKTFLKAYSLFIAATSSFNYLNSDVDGTMLLDEGILTRQSYQRKPIANFDLDNYNFMTGIIEGLILRVKDSINIDNLRVDFASYFFELADIAYNEGKKLENISFFRKVEELPITINEYTIPGFKRLKRLKKNSKTPESAEQDSIEMFNKPLQEFVFEPVNKELVAESNGTLKTLENAVLDLLFYDPKSLVNPVKKVDKRFIQSYLLVGGTGVGKTYVALAAMTMAKNLASKYRLPLFFPKFEFENSWQYGPVQAIRNIINKVNQGEKSHIILLDEVDSQIGDRRRNIDENRRTVIGELNKWLQVGYMNRGNYLIISTANSADDLDPAFVGRSKILPIEMPKDPNVHAEAFKIHLNGFSGNYVRVGDWYSKGVLNQKYGGKFRDISNICSDLLQKSRKRSSQEEALKMSFQEKIGYLQNDHRMITDEVLERAIHLYFENAEKAHLLSEQFNGKAEKEYQKIPELDSTFVRSR